jgi:putative membrane protein
MLLVGQLVAAVAGAIHVWIFVLESLRFERPEVWRRFGLKSAEQAAVVRGFAFNQGLYNLFLAIGVAIGLALMALNGGGELFAAGRAVVIFACGSMAAAGSVLVATDRSFARASALQIVPGLGAALLLLFA